MARRQRTSPLEDIFDILAFIFRYIPPWTSIPVALAGLILIPAFWLHPQETANGNPVAEGMNEFLRMPFAILRWCAGGIWAVLWLGAGFAGWRARRERAAFLQQNIDTKWLWSLHWREFEQQVAELFRQQGCQVEEVGGGGSDGGIDLVVKRDGGKVFVQCKHWREGKVGVKPVRELYGVMAAEGAQNGILITSGTFTNSASQFAEGKPLQLINGAECAQMFRHFQRSVAQAVGSPTVASNKSATAEAGALKRPKCPLCGNPMTLRRAKRGQDAGKEFWGCSQFPKTGCKGIVNLAD